MVLKELITQLRKDNWNDSSLVSVILLDKGEKSYNAIGFLLNP